MKRVKSRKKVKVLGQSFVIQRITGEQYTNAQGGLVGADSKADFTKAGGFRSQIVGAGVASWPYTFEEEDENGKVSVVKVTAANAGVLPVSLFDGLFEVIDKFNTAGK